MLYMYGLVGTDPMLRKVYAYMNISGHTFITCMHMNYLFIRIYFGSSPRLDSVLWGAQFLKARKYLTMPSWQLRIADAPGGAIDLDDEAEGQLVVPEGLNQSLAAVDWNVFKMQYCGCWSHTSMPGLKAPRDMPKAEFGELVQRLCERLFRTSSERRRTRLNKLGLCSVFQELHANQEVHYHFPVLADRPWSCVPLQRALRAEGIAVEFSTTHDYYWTTFIYLTVPGDGPDDKKEGDLDRNPWLGPGHPTVLDTLKDIPRGARSCDKARVRRYLAVVSGGCSKSKQDVALTDKDFAKHVVAKSMRDPKQLQAWVASMSDLLQQDGQQVSQDEKLVFVGLEAYMYKNQSDLGRRIAFAWEVVGAPRLVSARGKTAWVMLLEACSTHQCICGGRWIPLTEELLEQMVDALPGKRLNPEAPAPSAVRAAIRKALQVGCAKYTNVFFYGPKDAGKSHVIKPLANVFGDLCFVRPVGKVNNYPLQGLFDKKVALLQDFRRSTYKMGFDDLLVWFEGETFEVPLPQSSHQGNRIYNEAAPIFISAGSKLTIAHQEAMALQVDPYQQNEMMDGRFTFFRHPVAVRNPVPVKPCPRCFALWLRGTSIV